MKVRMCALSCPRDWPNSSVSDGTRKLGLGHRLSPFYRWRSLGIGRLSSLPKITPFEEVELRFLHRHCVFKARALNSQAIWL